MEGRRGGDGAVKDVHRQATPDDVLDLPPGFRFHPTDEEVITHYLTPKVLNPRFAAAAIAEVDLNKCEPWDMPCRAKIGEKDWYFFCQKDRKYPTGMRTNRATCAGYWKATGKDKEIYKGSGRNLAGMKKTLVFYMGRAPNGLKTNWVMNEFRLEGRFPYRHINKDEWVVCRVFNKTVGGIINNKDVVQPGSSPPEATDSATSFIRPLILPEATDSPSPPPPLVDPSNIASCSYLKCERDDLAEKNHPDHIGCVLISTNLPGSSSKGPVAAAGNLPQPPAQNYALNPAFSNPLGYSDESLQGQMGSTFLEGFEFRAHPSTSGQYFLGYTSLANNEISSAVTTPSGSDAGRCGGGGGYYGYLEGSLVDTISDYDKIWDFDSATRS